MTPTQRSPLALKIREVEAIPFELPLKRTIKWAAGSLERSTHVLIRVISEDGLIGTGEAVPRPRIYGETIRSILGFVADVIVPKVKGKTIRARGDLLAELDQFAANYSVKAAFDMALTDLYCRALGVSLRDYLGGEAADHHEAGQVLLYGSPEEMAQTAVDSHERYGIRCFKVKVGLEPITDARAVRLLRQGIPDALIYCDPNLAFDASGLARFIAASRDLDIAWIEEPSPAASPQCVAGGDETCRTPAEVADAIISGRRQLISVKVARSGIRQTQMIRSFCECASVSMVLGGQGESSIGLLTMLAFGTAFRSMRKYPGEYSSLLDLGDDLLTEPLKIEQGKVAWRDGPGSGIQIDEDKLARYRMTV